MREKIANFAENHSKLANLGAIAALGLASLVPGGNVEAAAPTSFASPAIEQRWKSVDALTAEQKKEKGQLPTYFYGPIVTGAMTMEWNGAPAFTTQLFEKGRLEDDGKGNVTAGLLATSLVSGYDQTGDTTFENLGPAHIGVAGDPGSTGIAYADLHDIASLQPGKNEAQPALGKEVKDKFVPRKGIVKDAYASKNNQKVPQVVYYSNETKQNVPDVIVAAFDKTPGNEIKNVGQSAKEMVDNLGYPITPAEWTDVKINGKDATVMVQAFQRRVVTYNPNNPPDNQVEMANSGLHYNDWKNKGIGRQTETRTPAATKAVATAAPTGEAQPTAIIPPEATAAPEASKKDITVQFTNKFGELVTAKIDNLDTNPDGQPENDPNQMPMVVIPPELMDDYKELLKRVLPQGRLAPTFTVAGFDKARDPQDPAPAGWENFGFGIPDGSNLYGIAKIDSNNNLTFKFRDMDVARHIASDPRLSKVMVSTLLTKYILTVGSNVNGQQLPYSQIANIIGTDLVGLRLAHEIGFDVDGYDKQLFKRPDPWTIFWQFKMPGSP